MMQKITLPSRSVLRLSGSDCQIFLQGLVSNDVNNLKENHALWAALLTPQGKWKADFFLYPACNESGQNVILLECALSQSDLILGTLNRYKLRADVQIEHSNYYVTALFTNHDKILDNISPKNDKNIVVWAQDPRLTEAGLRLISTEPLEDAIENEEVYNLHRIMLGLSDTRDCLNTAPFLLEANFDIFKGIAWEKGCYMGQEVTARTHYRGLVKKRLIRVKATQNLPDAPSIITTGQQEVGLLTSKVQNWGLAMLRLDSIGKPLQCDTIPLTPVLLNEQHKLEDT